MTATYEKVDADDVKVGDRVRMTWTDRFGATHIAEGKVRRGSNTYIASGLHVGAAAIRKEALLERRVVVWQDALVVEADGRKFGRDGDLHGFRWLELGRDGVTGPWFTDSELVKLANGAPRVVVDADGEVVA